ncbi:thioredoxin domain-containing protein 8-like [Sorex fumeus]|uniref:thioredoxin domain-containing protein 8-like n=1 Tax=Sorex fumeus TaxID=62283 RepID=UPI0024ACB268|nr:thioredoxin domain-containing protein 8-like [Sorex fumeus]
MRVSSSIFPSQNELKALLSTAGNKLVVVKFSTRWCGPCKDIQPLFNAMVLQYQNVLFATVDVDDSWELAETLQIKVIPTFQMFKCNQKIYKLCGADAKTLEAKIRELM